MIRILVYESWLLVCSISVLFGMVYVCVLIKIKKLKGNKSLKSIIWKGTRSRLDCEADLLCYLAKVFGAVAGVSFTCEPCSL